MLDFNSSANLVNSDNNNNEQINKQLNKLIDKALVKQRKSEAMRNYLGASRLGVSCSRYLQYEYQNVKKDAGRDFNGQTLRVFAVGHLFEELAIGWLRDAGFTLITEDKDGKQFGFSVAEGKIAGHVDGIITGSPDIGTSGTDKSGTDKSGTDKSGTDKSDGLKMQLPALWEMKSMHSRSWNDTVKKGLTLSKPIYAAQIALYQAYMEESFGGISKNPALFTAINKDTSELYHELIPFDGELAQRMSDKAVNIIKAADSGELLPRVAANRDFFECKYCAYQDRCWDQLVGEESKAAKATEVSHE